MNFIKVVYVSNPGKQVVYSCSLCDFKTPNYDNLFKHKLELDHNARAATNIVSTGFLEEEFITKESSFSPETAKYHCLKCGRQFEKYYKLNTHFYNRHQKASCNVCDKKFNKKLLIISQHNCAS